MIRVVVVEDSATARRYLTSLLASTGAFDVVAACADGESGAAESIARAPDLVVLDVFLPDLSAAEVVQRIRARLPAQRIVLLSQGRREMAEVFEALAAGALEFVRKPHAADKLATATLTQALTALGRIRERRAAPSVKALAPARVEVVAIAASTGGPSAVREFLAALPASFEVPILIAHHVWSQLEDALARWFSETTGRRIRIASGPGPLAAADIVLGRSDTDLILESAGVIGVRPAAATGFHPSADALLASAARWHGAGALAVVLSGIGKDGLEGARAVASAGGRVLCQDAESAVVDGMPGAVRAASLASASGAPEVLAALAAQAASPFSSQRGKS